MGRERLETLGCFKNQEKRGPLIFYCGTGWRSSIAFFLAYLLGCESKNYDDGFYGWSEDPTKEVRYSRPGTPVNEPSSVAKIIGEIIPECAGNAIPMSN